METSKKTAVIVVADDNPDDCLLIKKAAKNLDLPYNFYFVEDGTLLIDYLLRRGNYTNPEQSPRPNLILLDMNMPGKNGYQTLKEIKSDPVLRQIPVIIFTASINEDEVCDVYQTGANSVIPKPVEFSELVRMFKLLDKYWFQIVNLPPNELLWRLP